MTMTPLLQVQGVTKSFPGVKALSNVHLDLRPGEVLALAGENGAGKSTLMKLLSGIYTADEGEFYLNGEKLEVASPKHAQELGIAIIHQDFNLIPDLTVAQNIFVGREPRWAHTFLNERALNVKAQELIERLQLPLDPKQNVGALTVAKQQMVEIAKALSYEAEVLIMDEPTAALNDAEVATLHELIRRFIRPNTGVIYISHRMNELKVISDRVTVIRDGQYVDTLDVQTTSMKEVIALMVGRSITSDATPVGVRDDREVLLSVSGLNTKDRLKDVSFDLRKGEILGFAGLMGAGRTEVARAIVGADGIESGTITLRGKQISIRNPAEAAKHRIGYLSEDRKRYGLLLEQDVGANIVLSAVSELYAAWGFLKSKSMRATAARYVKTLRIKTPSINQMTKNLSGGNQQKVVIAKWLVKDCDILIFDEPTRGIDVGAKEEIYVLLNELAAQGKSIIMISSELPEVLRMSHRVVVMTEGRVAGILTADEATQESVMHYATLRDDERPGDPAERDSFETEQASPTDVNSDQTAGKR
ncbi:MAG: sugar ABC transporter ATP-binding protein [Candidatus Dormibacteraeota bacterium]|uniref:Sugar ABC transporter ATP-binding protein n=1 Tax=Candidatus Dormiibacter inghamiae TaxID=3127013 RepID=A0A934K7Z8_9BACT|nr:sugar ABC transporter ATP-binding protein [Candidatus Dormibacteraeota bacterium]MBJ7606765.1 sugar ABC transporter ATP-binding protein [Candidatus Dormibacteraeota bacterium]